ncbi:hypothetical protein, partial [Geobacillus zalihae]|uniref:hypothetical protein n=1 Tax=Geobacillus zalihae TaxID=213419 RepID=UPI0009F10F7C
QYTPIWQKNQNGKQYTPIWQKNQNGKTLSFSSKTAIFVLKNADSINLCFERQNWYWHLNFMSDEKC